MLLNAQADTGFPARPPSTRWNHRALPQSARIKVQLRQDDLQKMLRPSTRKSNKLQKEEVWPFQLSPTKEEDQCVPVVSTNTRGLFR
jgi:hypothetical protein